MKNTKDLTEGSIYKNFLLFAVPIIFATLFSQLYSTVDMFIAGRCVGDAALGAVGATSSFDTFLNCILTGFGVGFSVHVARLFGMKDYRRLKGDVLNMLVLASAAAALLGLLCILLREPLFALLRVDTAIKADAMLYFTVLKAGYVFLIINHFFVFVLHALGVTAFPFYMSMLAAVLNVGGNLVAVLALDMGVGGLAGASVLSSAVVTVFYVCKLRRCFRELGVEGEPFRFCPVGVRASLRYALPTCLQQAAMYAAGLALAPFINGLGAAATSAYAVINQVYSICAGVYQNSSKALSNYTAQCIGAGKLGSIRRGLGAGILQGVVLVFPFVLVICLFAGPVCEIFFPDGYTGEALSYAVLFVSSYLPFIFINLINNLAHSFFRGLGSMKLLLASTVLGSACRIAVTAALIPSMHFEGVFLGWVISWAVEAVFCLCLYLFRFRTESMLLRAVQ